MSISYRGKVIGGKIKWNDKDWVEMSRAEVTMMFGKKPDGAENLGMTKYSFPCGAHGVTYFVRFIKTYHYFISV